MGSPDYILGIAILGHELSLTLVDDDGQVIFIAEEERYSRIKRGEFVFHPDLALAILKECGVDPATVGTLAIAGDPSCWPPAHHEVVSFSPQARNRHLKAWVKAFHRILPKVRTTSYLRHHCAHAASAFFATQTDHAAIITVDGYGDGEVATILDGRDSSLVLLESHPFPHSLGYLFYSFANWLGLDGLEREGKLMALAAYGHPTQLAKLRSLFSARRLGQWRLANELISTECKSQAWTLTLEQLLGPGRRPDQPLQEIHFNYAASMQLLLETELLKLFRRARSLTGAPTVCCAGGVFLNCKANGILQNSGIFESYFFQPLAGDCGLSLGAALHASRKAGRPHWFMTHARLGSDLDLDKLPNAAGRAGMRITQLNDVAEAAVQKLVRGKVIGWCQGRMEVGPRSLCGRSLLADARSHQMSDVVNRIKDRELWRPFAPVVLVEETPELFGKVISAPYMNIGFRVTRPGVIPAAVHIDGTARVQTVSCIDPLTRRLLHRYREATGFGALLNTSFNLRGQPIARTVEDCLAFFGQSRVDSLFLGDFLVERGREVLSIESMPVRDWSALPREFELMILDLDNTVRTRVEDLCARAKGIIDLAVNTSFEISAPPGTQRSVNGKNLVMLLPGYLEVCVETLPRMLAWAAGIKRRCASLWLVDLSGKVLDSSNLLPTLNISSLNAQPLSDVEIHYLRSAARRFANANAANSKAKEPACR